MQIPSISLLDHWLYVIISGICSLFQRWQWHSQSRLIPASPWTPISARFGRWSRPRSQYCKSSTL